MNRSKLSVRVVAPLLVAALAVVIGASMAQGASFPTNINAVSVSATMFGGAPAGVLTVDPGISVTTLQLDNAPAYPALAVGFPAAGQVLVYDVDLKVGTKDNKELIAYDNGTCVEGPNQLCVTVRGQGGTANQAHPVGSTVKLATQIVSGPDGTPAIAAGTAAGFTIAVGSTAGFPSINSGTAANILIDNELFEVHNFGPTTYHVAERGVDTNAGNPTTQAAHAVGAIISSPDTYVFTMTRQVHNIVDNTVSSTSRPYTFLQPLFPVAMLSPFTAATLAGAPIKLTYAPGGSIPLPGTYNPTNGLLTIPFGMCGWPGGDTSPPTTLLGSATLQMNKGAGNQIGAFGSVRDTTHSTFSTLTAGVTIGQTVPFDMAVVSVAPGSPSGGTVGTFTGTGQVLVGGELMTYTSVGANTLHVTTRANAGGTVAFAHAIGDPVIQTPVCDEQAVGAKNDVHVLELGVNAAFDSDGDGCSNWEELNIAATAQLFGGLRDPWNFYDYMNPTKDKINRVDDILAVVAKYQVNDADDTPGFPPYVGAYDPRVDRTALTGPGSSPWTLGPPNGTVNVPDILAAVKSYHHDCNM